MIRKVFIGIVVAVALLLAAMIVFVNTFNLNRYLPQITRQAGEAVGRDVTIERARLHFSLFNGVSAGVEGVAIGDDPAISPRPFVTVAHIRCGVRFLPLIAHRRVEVSYILIDSPVVNIIKDKNGRFNFESMNKTTPNQPAAPSSGTGGAPATSAPAASDLPILLVSSFQLDKAKVTYVDRTMTPPVEFSASDIHVEVTDFSPTEPFKIKGEASFMSASPNVHANGLARLDITQQQIRLDDLHLDVNLDTIDVKKLNETVVGLQPVGIQSLKGNFNAVASQMLAGAAGLLVLSMDAQLSGGQVKLKSLAVPVDQISMKLDASESRINLKDFSFHLASGDVHGQGTVKDYLKTQEFNFNVDVNRIPLGDVIDQSSYPAQLKGTLSGDVKINGRGFTPEAMSAMTGQSNFSLTDGEVVNMNLLKAVLGPLSAIPGLGDVESRLPADLRQKLSGKSTPIDQADVKARIEQSNVLIDQVQLQAQGFKLAAHGAVGFDQTVALDAQMVLLKDLAAVLADANESLGALADENQQIAIPVKIRGKGAAISVVPDLNDISKKLLVDEGSKQLEKVIQKNPGVKQIIDIFTGGGQPENSSAPPDAEESSTNSQESPQKKLLNSLFKGF